MRQLLPEPRAHVDLERVYAYPPAHPGVHPAVRTGVHSAPGSPHVRLNFVGTPDGAASLAGRSEPLSGPADKRLFGLLRGLADVILVGAGTVRAEGYGPAKAGPERRAMRERLGLSPVPPIAVVTSSLDLDLTSAFFTDAVARPLVLTSGRAPQDRTAAADEVADVVVVGGAAVDLERAVAELGARGLRRVLCEGGPTLFGELLLADLVDELCLTLAPVLAGGGHHRLTGDVALPEPRRFALGSLLEDDDSLFLRYVRR